MMITLPVRASVFKLPFDQRLANLAERFPFESELLLRATLIENGGHVGRATQALHNRPKRGRQASKVPASQAPHPLLIEKAGLSNAASAKSNLGRWAAGPPASLMAEAETGS